MTIATTINLATLKKVKNNVIGNPSAKLALAQDELFVAMLVNCLNDLELDEGASGSQDSIRVEAAQVISSLSYGSPDALHSLLCANAHQAFLYAISRFTPSEPSAVKFAFARALRALAAATADHVGPSQWGLKDDAAPVHEEAKAALDYLFQQDPLDVYLPLLADPSPQTSASIAQLLGAALRAPDHRAAVAAWVPPSERTKTPRRGWEKGDMGHSGWVARQLTALARSRDAKVQEAALGALAALTKDNHDVAAMLSKPTVDPRAGTESPSALSLALSLCKSRTTPVQLAGALCATHILRAQAAGSHGHHPHLHHPHAALTHSGPGPGPDMAAALTVIHVTNRLIASNNETPQARTQACFVLQYLVMDEKELCQTAFESGSLTKLSDLVRSITPANGADPKSPLPVWDEDEALSICRLREAALTAIAVLASANDDIRRDLTDSQRLIPPIRALLAHPHPGTRYAAAQCVRALSRSVAVARTSLVDSGLGTALFGVFLKEGEDRRVTYAALMAVCNLINEFSPLRQPFLDQGLMKRLVVLLKSEYDELRLNALWAVKNLVYRCASETKRAVIKEIGWKELGRLMEDPDAGVQEQAIFIVRNVADCEDDVELVFREIGSPRLLDVLGRALESKNGDVVLQAAYTLSNLANGSGSRKHLILSHTQILRALRSCLVDSPMDVRNAAVSCVLELAKANDWKHQELREAGLDSTLRHICEYAGPVSPGAAAGVGPGTMGVERDVREKARKALDYIEHGGDMVAG